MLSGQIARVSSRLAFPSVTEAERPDRWQIVAKTSRSERIVRAAVGRRRRAPDRARDPHARRGRARRARGALGRRRARRARALGARLRQRGRGPAAERRRAAALHRVGVADRADASSRRSSRSSSTPGIAGLVLELGVHYRYVPAVVEAAAREHGLALVALHREVKFVALTEAVHSRIISEQTAALRARDEVRERFTALSLRGSPADFIVHQLAQTLGAAVVLENLAHEVVAAEVPPAAEEELFATWEARSRRAHRLRRAAPRRGAARRGPTSGSSCPSRPAASGGGTSSRCPARRTPPAARACSSRAPSRWRSAGSPTATPTSGCASAGSASSTGCSPGGSPGSAVRPRGSRRPGSPSTARTSTASSRRVRRSPRGAADAAARALGGRAIDGAAPDSAGAVSASGAARIVLLSVPAELLGCRGARVRVARSWAAMRHPSTGSCSRSGGVADGLDGLLGSVQEAIDLARAPAPRGARGVVAATCRRPPAHAARHLAARRPPAAAAQRADARAAHRVRPRARRRPARRARRDARASRRIARPRHPRAISRGRCSTSGSRSSATCSASTSTTARRSPRCTWRCSCVAAPRAEPFGGFLFTCY